MKPTASAWIALVALSCFSCAIPPKAGGNAPAQEESPSDSKKRAQEEKAHQLEIARMRLEIALAAQKADEIESEASIAKAKWERDNAEKEMKQFLEVDMPRRIEEARLRLLESKDGIQDSKEELAQLEDMYKDGDLADKTREIVLSRGKRKVERSLKRLSLQEIELQTLETFRLPMEKARVLMTLREKTDALAKAERDAARSKIDKTIAVKNAEFEVAKKEAEIKAKP